MSATNTPNEKILTETNNLFNKLFVMIEELERKNEERDKDWKVLVEAMVANVNVSILSLQNVSKATTSSTSASKKVTKSADSSSTASSTDGVNIKITKGSASVGVGAGAPKFTYISKPAWIKGETKKDKDFLKQFLSDEEIEQIENDTSVVKATPATKITKFATAAANFIKADKNKDKMIDEAFKKAKKDFEELNNQTLQVEPVSP